MSLEGGAVVLDEGRVDSFKTCHFLGGCKFITNWATAKQAVIKFVQTRKHCLLVVRLVFRSWEEAPNI